MDTDQIAIRYSNWRQRLLDMGVVLLALLFIAFVWPRFRIGFGAYLAAIGIWASGLSLMGHYKAVVASDLSTSAGKLLVDHAILCATWLGTLFLFGSEPGIGVLVPLGGGGYAGLVLARVRRSAASNLDLHKIPGSLAASDIVCGALLFYAVNGLWWGLHFSPSLLVAVVLGRALVQCAPCLIGRPLIAWIASQVAFTLLLLGLRPILQWAQTPWHIVIGGGLVPAMIIGSHRLAGWWRPPTASRELWRRLALLTGVFALLHPLFSSRLIGTSDAKLYAEAMQDFIGQIRAGIFPVFVSQTEVAPWGSVFPFRMAFYHFHFGALLDLATARSLNVYSVQHLTLVLSAACGAFTAYFALRRLAPNQPWECVLLALLYIACPAWLSALYGLDMYFTVMTLPWLPLVIYAVIRTIRPDCNWRGYGILGVSLAATWLAHPPVGFWASIVVAVSQILRLATARQWPRIRDVYGLGLSMGICLVLCAGLFVSLADVRISGESLDPSAQVISSLNSVAPAVFKPVSPAADRLSDMQLGYALQILLVVGIVFRPRGRPGRAHGILLGLSAGLILLIYPVPGINAPLWRALPWEVTNITNVWPMQRLYPLLAALAVFVAIGAIGAAGATRKAKALRLAALGILCLWSGSEATKFLGRGLASTKSPEASRVASMIENSPLLSSWTAYTPHLPGFPLVGFVNDPRLRNRLLDSTTKRELVSNHRFAQEALRLLPGTGNPVAVQADHLDRGVLRLTPGFTLNPGFRYQLTFDFSGHDYAGMIQLLPLPDIYPRFYREVSLTQRPFEPLTLTVWTSASDALQIDLLFRPANPTAIGPGYPAFMDYRLNAYRASDLPIKITSLAPYVARVETAQPGFLETHRFFARGYRATVNGRVVSVAESPNHLAMVPLELGMNEVRLDYVGPAAVRAAFWISALAWLAITGFAVWLVFAQSWLARTPTSVQST